MSSLHSLHRGRPCQPKWFFLAAAASHPYGVVRAADWKLIENYEDMSVELYNLKEDLSEAHDLAKERPKQADELRKMLHKWRKSVDAQMSPPNPDLKH